jgi:hypothetical protein
MLTWIALRNAAYLRHAWWNLVFEDADPECWRTHRDMVRRFYGW